MRVLFTHCTVDKGCWLVVITCLKTTSHTWLLLLIKDFSGFSRYGWWRNAQAIYCYRMSRLSHHQFVSEERFKLRTTMAILQLVSLLSVFMSCMALEATASDDSAGFFFLPAILSTTCLTEHLSLQPQSWKEASNLPSCVTHWLLSYNINIKHLV